MRRLALICALPLFAALPGCNGQDAKSSAAKPNGTAPATSPDGLKKLVIKDSAPGKGPAASLGDTVWVSYIGRLRNGTIFDSTERNGNKPFAVTLGSGQVIEGWEKGLIGLKKGGKRTLEIPAKMGYGDAGSPPKIPAKADLEFEIEGLYLIKQGDEDVIEVTDTKVGTGPAVRDAVRKSPSSPIIPGSTVTIKYKGLLVNGEEFDSTEQVKKPITFTIGKREVLVGIESGVVGMKKGGKRRIVVPPKLGVPYGNNKIPANNPLVFEIEALDVK